MLPIMLSEGLWAAQCTGLLCVNQLGLCNKHTTLGQEASRICVLVLDPHLAVYIYTVSSLPSIADSIRLF